jgi:hypothetical protein
VQFTGAGGLIASASAFAFVFNEHTARTLNYGFHRKCWYAWFRALDDPCRPASQMDIVRSGVAGVCVGEGDAFLLVFAAAVSVALVAGRTMKRIERLVFLPAPGPSQPLNLILYYGFVVPLLSATGAHVLCGLLGQLRPTALTGRRGNAASPDAGADLDADLAVLTANHPCAPVPAVDRLAMGGPASSRDRCSMAPRQTTSCDRSGIYYAIVLVPFLVLATARGAELLAGVVITATGSRACCGKSRHRARALLAGISNAGYSFEALEKRNSMRFPIPTDARQRTDAAGTERFYIRTPATNPAFRC